MGNICVLILAHKNIEQVKRLCRRIKNTHIHIIIHLDKKMSVGKDDRNDLMAISSQLYVCSERYSCTLDDWSLIEATLTMIRNAQKQIQNIRYYALLSGQDYPIKPISEFVNFLHNNYPQPYIDCTPYNISNWIYPKFNHTILMKYAKRIKQTKHIKGIVYIISLIEKILPHCLFTDYKLQKYGIPIYGGSAWWVLPDIIINEIMKIVDKDKEFIDCYKRSITPEETFFQTLAKNSSLSAMISLNEMNQIEQNCLTFSSFFIGKKEFMGHPHIIKAENFDILIRKNIFFARKFDMNIDSSVLELIDKHIGC